MNSNMRVALVTGGGRRLGAGIVRALAQQQWRVLVHCHHSVDEARQLVDELNASSAGTALCLQADLGDNEAVAGLAEQALAAFGRLDGLVNNASCYFPTPAAGLAPEQFDELFASNLKAPMLLISALAGQMRGGGSIVNIVDSQLSRAVPGYAAYSAAKAGLLQLTRNLARDLAPHLRVNSVAPGHILWAQNNRSSESQRRAIIDGLPMKRLGDVAAIGNAVAFLMSAEANYITGVNLPVDGGLSLL